MTYQGPLKRSFLRRGEVSLEVRCLRDGTLDVDLDTGKVYGRRRRGVPWAKKRLRHDKDGYLMFDLNRERRDRRGKPYREVINGKEVFRWRRRRKVRVNRLVKIKALAVAMGGKHWRQYASDLPFGIDVNHIGDRDDNRHTMIELQTEGANRCRREMTPEEQEEVNNCPF